MPICQITRETVSQLDRHPEIGDRNRGARHAFARYDVSAVATSGVWESIYFRANAEQRKTAKSLLDFAKSAVWARGLLPHLSAADDHRETLPPHLSAALPAKIFLCSFLADYRYFIGAIALQRTTSPDSPLPTSANQLDSLIKSAAALYGRSVYSLSSDILTPADHDIIARLAPGLIGPESVIPTLPTAAEIATVLESVQPLPTAETPAETTAETPAETTAETPAETTAETPAETVPAKRRKRK